MDFKTFQANCKHAKYGLKHDTVREFELTCRKPDRIPQGYSWNKCDEYCCPFFGMKCTSGVAIEPDTNVKLFLFSDCNIVYSISGDVYE